MPRNYAKNVCRVRWSPEEEKYLLDSGNGAPVERGARYLYFKDLASNWEKKFPGKKRNGVALSKRYLDKSKNNPTNRGVKRWSEVEEEHLQVCAKELLSKEEEKDFIKALIAKFKEKYPSRKDNSIRTKWSKLKEKSNNSFNSGPEKNTQVFNVQISSFSEPEDESSEFEQTQHLDFEGDNSAENEIVGFQNVPQQKPRLTSAEKNYFYQMSSSELSWKEILMSFKEIFEENTLSNDDLLSEYLLIKNSTIESNPFHLEAENISQPNPLNAEEKEYFESIIKFGLGTENMLENFKAIFPSNKLNDAQIWSEYNSIKSQMGTLESQEIVHLNNPLNDDTYENIEIINQKNAHLTENEKEYFESFINSGLDWESILKGFEEIFTEERLLSLDAQILENYYQLKQDKLKLNSKNIPLYSDSSNSSSFFNFNSNNPIQPYSAVNSFANSSTVSQTNMPQNSGNFPFFNQIANSTQQNNGSGSRYPGNSISQNPEEENQQQWNVNNNDPFFF